MRLLKAVLTLLSVVTNVAFLFFEKQLTAVNIGIAVAFYCLSSSIHLLTHECGHFIGGIFSGYRLLCLQLGPLNILRNSHGKLSLMWKSQLSGQCIMLPKQIESIPFKAYNMGGVFANLFVSALSFLLLFFNSFYLYLLFIELLFIGVQKAIINLIPHKTHSIPNDSYVVKLLKQDKAIQRDYAMYLNLYGNLFLNEHIEPKDYIYERKIPENIEEMIYYNEIQDILNSYKSEGL